LLITSCRDFVVYHLLLARPKNERRKNCGVGFSSASRSISQVGGYLLESTQN